jgi:hypothetical protein
MVLSSLLAAHAPNPVTIRRQLHLPGLISTLIFWLQSATDRAPFP